MSHNDLMKIKPATTIIYKTAHSYHVGLLLNYKEFYFYTIEANTSNSRAIEKFFRKGEGVFYLKTKLQGYRGFKPLYLCDCIEQGTKL